jgi:hypothetical protein
VLPVAEKGMRPSKTRGQERSGGRAKAWERETMLVRRSQYMFGRNWAGRYGLEDLTWIEEEVLVCFYNCYVHGVCTHGIFLGPERLVPCGGVVDRKDILAVATSMLSTSTGTADENAVHMADRMTVSRDAGLMIFSVSSMKWVPRMEMRSTSASFLGLPRLPHLIF